MEQTYSETILSILQSKELSEEEKGELTTNLGEIFAKYELVVEIEGNQGDVYIPKYRNGWIVKEYNTTHAFEQQKEYLLNNQKNGLAPSIYLINTKDKHIFMEDLIYSGYLPILEWYQKTKLSKEEIRNLLTKAIQKIIFVRSEDYSDTQTCSDIGNLGNVFVHRETNRVRFNEVGSCDIDNIKPIGEVVNTLLKALYKNK